VLYLSLEINRSCASFVSKSKVPPFHPSLFPLSSVLITRVVQCYLHGQPFQMRSSGTRALHMCMFFFLSLFHLTAQHSPTFPCRWVHDRPLPPTGRYTHRNNHDSDAPHGTTTATVTPHVAQRLHDNRDRDTHTAQRHQLRHSTQRNDRDHDTHAVQRPRPRRPMRHNNDNHDAHVVQQWRLRHHTQRNGGATMATAAPMRCNDSDGDTPRGATTVTATAMPHSGATTATVTTTPCGSMMTVT
jgi:hypothetical protein